VLIVADLATYWALRSIVRSLRDGALGDGVGGLVSTLFAEGFLGGPQYAVALVLSLLIAGAYGAGERRRDTGRVLYGVALAALISLYTAAWSEQLLLVVLQFTATVALVGSTIAGTRNVVDAVVKSVRRRRGGTRTILVAHESANWKRLEELVSEASDITLVSSVRLPDRADATGEVVLAGLADEIERSGADTVLLWTDLSEDEFAYAVDVSLASGCRLWAGPRTPTKLGVQPRAVWIDGWPLVELTAPGLQAWQLAAKRAIDVVGAGIGLVVLSPILLGIGIWIKLDSPGPVLFSQARVGARGRTFRMRKFRSMRVDAEDLLRTDPELNRLFRENGFKIPAELDPRLTPSGRLLRKTSIDELPQLLNVLAGSMSLVGPRPIEPVELEHSGHHYGSHGMPVFLSVKPGITGAWAVNGRSSVGYPDRARMELDYIRGWSIGSDLMILLRTLPAIITKRGAH
jgi:lipopolysaccharide/colanic/teichoic acid biosynthesis glycosyltransferase